MNRDFLVLIGLALLAVAGGVSMHFVSDDSLSRVSTGVQSILLAGVFLVTAYYAIQTRKIADGTKALAEQTALQMRYGFVPIIDIVADPGGTELIEIGLLAKKGDSPEGISCRLTNVGRGPAFNCGCQVVGSAGLVTPLVVPTFLVDYSMDSVLGPRPNSASSGHSSLLLKVETDSEGSPLVRVAYQDVFGQKWASSKAFLATTKHVLLGPLQFESAEEEPAGC